MVSASGLFGDIPQGDKLRTTGKVSFARTGVETTLLNVASGGGIVHYLMIDPVDGGDGDVTLSNIKVTIDGAAERTLDFGGIFPILNATSAGHINALVLPLPISFRTSCIVKINMSSNVGTNLNVVVVYSVK